MSKVDIARNMALFALTLALGACGGIHRSYLVADRQDAEGLIDAIDQVSRARGYETRTREGRVVKLVFDRGTGSRMAFSLRRNGVLLTVSVDEERVAPSDVEAELARVEAAGRELLALARVEAAEVARVQALRAEEEAAAERARAAQAQQESADREADGARLRAFMDQNQARHDAFRARNDPPAASAAPTQAPGQGGGGAGSVRVSRHHQNDNHDGYRLSPTSRSHASAWSRTECDDAAPTARRPSVPRVRRHEPADLRRYGKPTPL